MYYFAGKVLNIAPKACTSSEFPGIVGTCMISLECQQRSGTVIGACRDGHLFGACCSDAAAELPTAEPLKNASSTTPLPPQPPKDHLHQSFKIPQSLLDLAIFSIASDKQDHKEGESDDPSNNSVTTDNPIVEISTMTMSGHNNTLRNVTPAIVPTQSTTPIPTTTTISTITQAKVVHTTTTTIPTTTTPTIRTTTTAASTSHAHPISQETSTTKQTTTSKKPSTEPTTKFTYGKIKYSPRPVKLRSTTEKMIWTRPPTTEASYSIFTSSTEDEDDEEIGNEISKRSPQPNTASTIMLSASSGSVETSTLPVQQPPLSNEEVATTLIAPTISENSLTTLLVDVTAKPIDTPITTEKVSSTSTTKSTPTNTYTTTANFASSLAPKTNSAKQSRLSNEIDDDDSESSSSAGWDNKINEFVNQVNFLSNCSSNPKQFMKNVFFSSYLHRSLRVLQQNWTSPTLMMSCLNHHHQVPERRQRQRRRLLHR